MTYTISDAHAFINSNLHHVKSDFRPKYHACPPIGWMNDPNGVIYYKDFYHVFYQYHPYSAYWGPMHWGHFISKDLIKYHDAPIALAPDQNEESGCFSGGAIINDKNQLVLMYTQHYENGQVRERQNIAISDDGITFVKNAHPVLTEDDIPPHSNKRDFRDPRPLKIGDQYYVLVGSKSEDNVGQILVYQSKDLKEFHYHFTIGPHPLFGEMGECPDLFHLDGKDVLLVSGINLKPMGKEYRKANSSVAFIGHFDLANKTYTIDQSHEIDLGHDFYAPQTLVDPNGRRIMITWMNMWAKEYYTSKHQHAWSGQLTLPRQLSVKDNHLYQAPIDRIQHYYQSTVALRSSMTISKWSHIELSSSSHAPWSLKLLHPQQTDDFIEVRHHDGHIVVDTSHTKLFPQPPIESRTKATHHHLDIFFDSSSIEVFINDGVETITSLVYMDTQNYQIHIDDPHQTLQGVIHRIE